MVVQVDLLSLSLKSQLLCFAFKLKMHPVKSVKAIAYFSSTRGLATRAAGLRFY